MKPFCRNGLVAIAFALALAPQPVFGQPSSNALATSQGSQASVAPGPCRGPTNHAPGGPDGTGTCWPGPANTGPDVAETSMAAYSGPCNVTSANTVIESKVIRCNIVVGPGASGLVIRNSYIFGS